MSSTSDDKIIKVNTSFIPYGMGSIAAIIGLYETNGNPLATSKDYLKSAAIYGAVGLGLGWVVSKVVNKLIVKSVSKSKEADAESPYAGKDKQIYDLFVEIGSSRPEVGEQKIKDATDFVAKNFNDNDKDVLIEFYSFVANALKTNKDIGKVLEGAVDSVRTKYGQPAIEQLGKKMMEINKILTK